MQTIMQNVGAYRVIIREAVKDYGEYVNMIDVQYVCKNVQMCTSNKD